MADQKRKFISCRISYIVLLWLRPRNTCTKNIPERQSDSKLSRNRCREGIKAGSYFVSEAKLSIKLTTPIEELSLV